MKKFLSIFIAVAMVLSFASAFGGQAAPIAKAAGNPLEVHIVYPGGNLTVNPGDTFYVDAVISNPTSDAVTDTATLTLDDTTKAEILDSASKSISLGDHGVQDVWWKVKCLGPGDVKLTVTAGTGSDSVTVEQTGQAPQAKKLHITWIETPCGDPFNGEVPVGTYFTVKAKIQSDFDYAENVSVKIGYTGALQLLSAETVPVGDVYTTRNEEVAWNFKCVGEGDASVFIADVVVGNLTASEVELPDECSFHQGPYSPPPTPSGDFTVTVNGPNKICTDCGSNTFDITAKGHNATGDVVNDVYAEISISPLLSATLSTGETQRKFVDDTVNDGEDSNTVSWNITCLQEGDTTFTVKFYSGGGDTLGAGTYLGQNTWVVRQKKYMTTVDDVYADPTDSTDFITFDGDVYTTEECDTFHVKTTFKNCTCYPIDNVHVQILRDGLPAGDLGSVSLDPDSVVTVEEHEVDPGTGVDHVKGNYTVPATAVINNGYKLPLQTNCACCYFVVYWKFKCTGSDFESGPQPLIFEAIDDSTGTLLDSDSFKLEQLTAPKLSAGIDIFPGWWNDNTLGTEEITGVASQCGGGSLGASSEFTIVIPIANTGDVTATDVYATVSMSGDFGSVTWKGEDGTSNGTVDFSSGSHTFDIGSIPAHSAYKIILETTCTGDTDIAVNVTNLDGKDALTGKWLSEGDPCGVDNLFLPKERDLMQIPMDLIIIEPENDTHFEVSSNYAVKIKIENCTNDETNIVHGLHATLTWDGPAEFNPDTNETATHDLGDLDMGGIAETGWNIHCSGLGDVTFTVTVTANEPALTMTQTVIIHQDPTTEVNVEILSPANMSVYATGQQFAVTATVTNDPNGLPAEDVVVSIDGGDAAKVVDDPNTSPQEITVGTMAPGESKTFTWTMQCTKPSESNLGDPITVKAEGLNFNGADATINVFQYPAAKLVVNLDPISDVAKGSDFEITGTIGNYGWADATNVVLTMNASSNLMPQPGYSFTLPIGTVPAARDNDEYQPIPFTFHVQCEDAGKTTVTVTPSGADEYGFSWLWANRTVIDSITTTSDFIDFVQDVMFDNGVVNPYALKPIPDFCIVPVSTTFKQVLPEGPSLTVATDASSPTQSRDITVTYSATGGTEPYTFAAKVDDGAWVSPIPADSYTFHGLTDGAHTLYIMVTDANGKYYIGFVNVVVDTTAPPAPSANPVGGVYNAEQTVTLSDAESGVSIYYTTDGTIPTASSTLYTAPISIGEGITTLKAIAVDAAGNVSDVMTEIYNINIPPSQVSVTLNLIDGWNLISVPFETSTSNLGTNVDQVYEWNGTVWAPVSMLEPGVGYLIHHSGSETITLSGAPTAAPFTIAVNGTWQLIGDPFEVAVPWSSIDGVSNISMAFYWDGTVWQPVNLATDSMQPGVGYLILTSNAGNLTFQRP